MRVEQNRASWVSVAPVARTPGRHLRRGGRLLPRGSCPYAGTTRIRFEGLPRPIFSGRRRLSPPSGAPLASAVIRRQLRARQGQRGPTGLRAGSWARRLTLSTGTGNFYLSL